MKSLKMFGLAAAAAAAMMAFAGVASATVATSPTGTQYNGAIKAELPVGINSTLTSPFIGEVLCQKSIIEFNVESQGSGVTASGTVSTLDFTSCNGHVTTLKSGTLEIHTDPTDSSPSTYNGILTSTGAEVTVELFGLHCIFTTNGTSLGTVTGGNPASFKAASASIPRTGGRSGIFCGSNAAWNAQYTIVTPKPLYID